MKIKKELIVDAFDRLTNQTTNKFWGLISIFSSISTSNNEINSQITYNVDTIKLSKKLQNLFYYGNNPKKFKKTPLFIRLSCNWTKPFIEQLLKDKPSIMDVALFFFKDEDFEHLKSSELVNLFIKEIRLPYDKVTEIFDMKYDDLSIQLEKSYSKSEIFRLIKTHRKVKNHSTLTVEPPYVIASHPSELQRAPFIQTLYSGTKIQELLLLTKFDFDKYYINRTTSINLNTHPNTIYYGAPGTGKSHTIKQLLQGIAQNQKERVTFHPEYDHTTFVGGYMPIMEDDQIKYKFVPQVFTNMYVKAWQNTDKPYFLVIEEINRGNCAEIFGDIFQLLDRQGDYAITPNQELKKYLIATLGQSHDGIKDGKMRLPNNLQLLATMNTSDQSLFPMDSAFKRRWTWKYVPIDYNNNAVENKSAGFKVLLSDTEQFSWLDFIEKVNEKIKQNENLGSDKCIGNYFINPLDNEISLEEFINKAIFYLWIDVFREEEETPFGDATYEEFFPELSNGVAQVRAMLEQLEVTIEERPQPTTDEDID